MELIKKEWYEDDVNNLIAFLKEISKNNYKVFHSKIVPNINNFIGVTIPDLRNITKKILKGNYLQFVEVSINFDVYEIDMINALIIAKLKDVKLFDKYLKMLLPHIKNWCVCDIFVGDAKILGDNKNYYFNILKNLILTNDVYNIRFSLVAFLKYYKDRCYYDEIINTMQTINNNDYYVEMAMAWLLQELSVLYPNKIKEILKSSIFNKSVKLKTVQKIKDSKRNTLEYKSCFKGLQ